MRLKTLSSLSLAFLLAGYSVVAGFLIMERSLRKSESAKTLVRSESDRGSTLLIGVSFGVALLAPVVLDAIPENTPIIFPMSVLEGSFALLLMLLGLGIRIWSARSLGR